ncbi:hypothetical protein M5362_09590 [Streptomyces sp. Je 1-79]|uniref:hypothetical protein n=1 Tax=Streptomyces sp. Je 1-79 TaxID=2943847 RepID=UPI0021A8C348|nr:hypothetical protein [Streptomyces sp. Je 1-79]MCT4353379.1 hypothetical protein [Streptomyces sp. Je 1-79]
MTDRATRYVDVVAVRHDATAPAGQTTVIRLLGLLPAHWACAPVVAADRILLRIALDGETDPPAVRGTVATVLADAALRGWSVPC